MQRNNIHDIPADVMLNIINLCSFSTKLSLSMTDKSFKRMIEGNNHFSDFLQQCLINKRKNGIKATRKKIQHFELMLEGQTAPIVSDYGTKDLLAIFQFAVVCLAIYTLYQGVDTYKLGALAGLSLGIFATKKWVNHDEKNLADAKNELASLEKIKIS